MNKKQNKIKDLPGFIKDPSTGALINTDKIGYRSYIETRKRNMAKNQELENLKKEVDVLKDMVEKLIGMQHG